MLLLCYGSGNVVPYCSHFIILNIDILIYNRVCIIAHCHSVSTWCTTQWSSAVRDLATTSVQMPLHITNELVEINLILILIDLTYRWRCLVIIIHFIYN